MTETPLRYAGFWRRAGAFLIDSVILLIAFAPLLYGLYGPAYFHWAAEHNGLLAYYSLPELLITRVVPLVLVVALWSFWGWTPGKRLLDCRIVDARTGDGISARQAFIRYLGYLVSMLPLYLGFLWIGWDGRKQGFHDKLAGTIVIRTGDEEAGRSLDALMKEAS